MSEKLVTDALDYLQQQLRDRMNSMADHVSVGGCQDWPDYMRCVGIIHGYAEAERELIDLQQRLIDE